MRLVDIARELGVDKSTVSLGLRKDPRISEKTRIRIEKKAEEMGYRRDASLEILSAYRWPESNRMSHANIAVIQPRKPPTAGSFQEFVNAAESRAKSIGFSLSAFYVNDFSSHNHLARVLKARGIRGLMIYPFDQRHDWSGFPWDEFCAVTCQGGFGVPPLHVIREDHFADVLHVHARLWEEGFRRIGLVPQYNAWSTTDEQRVAACHFIHRHLVPSKHRIPVLPLAYPVKKPILSWIERHDPEVIIATSAGMYYYLKENGYRIPEDLGVAILEVNQEEHLHISGIAKTYELLGSRAVDFLLDMMRRNDSGIPVTQETLSLRSTWLPGESLGTPR